MDLRSVFYLLTWFFLGCSAASLLYSEYWESSFIFLVFSVLVYIAWHLEVLYDNETFYKEGERYFCPICEFCWFGSNIVCPACGGDDTIICYTDKIEAQAGLNDAMADLGNLVCGDESEKYNF